MRLLFAAFALFMIAAPAGASDYKTLLDIPDGQTLVNLSATERVEVEQDLLVASLRFESQNKDARALQSQINDIMTEALKAAKKVDGVKAATQQYYVYPYDYDPKGRPVHRGDLPPKLERIWRGQQGLVLKSKKADDLLKLVGELQELGLTMTGLNYTLSPELLETTRDSLLEAALEKVTAKAARTGKALGKSKSDILEINIDMGGHYPQPMMARAEMGMDMAMAANTAPVAAPGESQITMTVTARAVLKP